MKLKLVSNGDPMSHRVLDAETGRPLEGVVEAKLVMGGIGGRR